MPDPDIDYYPKEVHKSQIINLLKEQQLYNLYNQFDRELKTSPNSDICHPQCFKELPKDEGIEKKLFELCNVMCNLLLNFSNIKGFCKDNYCCVKFYYLNIWLYEKIKEISISSSSSVSSTLINNFYNALNIIKITETSSVKTCPIINFNSLDTDFKPIKYVYEFLHIFNDIKEKISNNHGGERKIYCKHIQEFFKYYNNIKGKCTNPSGIKYCTEIDIIPRSIDRRMINTILSKCDYEEIKCENDSSVNSVIPCLKDKEVKLTLPKTDSVPPELVRILSTGIISLIPIVTTFSIFYKFTPLGYWLRSKMLKKKNITEHIREVNHDILDHNSRIEEINLNNDRYNIKYN
ncbi:Plasmodium vivax Vir protein, putative [Plasmodium vivax]|uniref:Vir protein, putative n=1 Tax=Plasmodium vivax TaxID=5855 RepID=A0A1G4GSN2_PLAVI|nr:Plasmodium vivax Vir protein, putative [Plasmodium vivax]